MKYLLILISSSILCFTSHSGVTKNSTSKQNEVKKLSASGVKLETGSRLLLSQHLSKSGVKKGTLYKVEFVCEHTNKIDTCSLVTLKR